MAKFVKDLQKLIDGEVDDSAKAKDYYSHDASMFELRPELVAFPKNSEDIQKIVKYVGENKAKNSSLSITPRSAGTCMSGGAINQSIILDMTKHFNQIGEVSATSARVQPGVFYRDFEAETLKHDALMPSYPASRGLCSVGGMVANNAGGERSLQFGKTEKFITELKVVFSDGREYTVKPLNKQELDEKLAQKDFEGKLYRGVFKIVDENYEAIRAAKPKVSKDSTGYHLWNVWDRAKGRFDLTQLIVGSQGTLGIVTDIKFKLVKKPAHSGTLVIFLRDMNKLGEIIQKVLKKKPATFEGFDNYTLMLSFKLFFYFHKTLGWWGLAKLGFQLIPDALKLMRGIPKMVLLVEFNDNSPEAIKRKIHQLHEELNSYNKVAAFEEDETEDKARKFWIMRRESFNLLRNKVKDKHTAPFIDDLVVPPEHLTEFLPKLRETVNKYKLLATIAGHMGDGNFHVIPLMEFELASEKKKLEPCMREVNDLVLSYGGSMSGEHNDGMSRGPWLSQQYSEEIMGYFKEVKKLFDPKNIFNPKKKTDADWQFSMSHLREHF
ncbi:MAG TPA: FAD-binding oxidoreductase [Candidatus Saccharimonadales bacterium]|nr:FAD-binding oxidoreductase [Candidatus Saccharimonadales bacterium]